jgi:hypothetical protein
VIGLAIRDHRFLETIFLFPHWRQAFIYWNRSLSSSAWTNERMKPRAKTPRLNFSESRC